MEFNHFLTSYMPNVNHFINLLKKPSPLHMAVKIPSISKKLNITTGIVVLPIHDMRTYAGEVTTADILTDGRLILGVGRGAFPWEMERLGTPIETSKEKFVESLEVLQLLLKDKEVSYQGKFYNLNQ